MRFRSTSRGLAPRPGRTWPGRRLSYAEHVALVLDQMAPRVVVVGHSFGGRVALHLAAARPDRIAALVLTGVPLVRPSGATQRPPALRYRVGRALHRRGLLRDTWMEHLRQRYGSEDYRRASGAMRDVLVKAVNETYEAQLAGFAGPIELVWGASDDQVPVSVAEAAMTSCREPKLSVIPAIGHFLPLEAPEALIQAVNRHRPSSVASASASASTSASRPDRPVSGEPERLVPERSEPGRAGEDPVVPRTGRPAGGKPVVPGTGRPADEEPVVPGRERPAGEEPVVPGPERPAP